MSFLLVVSADTNIYKTNNGETAAAATPPHITNDITSSNIASFSVTIAIDNIHASVNPVIVLSNLFIFVSFYV